MLRKILPVFAIILFAQVVMASVVCDPSEVAITFTQGDSIDSQSIYCTNNLNQSVSIGEDSLYFEIDETVIGASPSSKSITITFDNNAPVGTHFNTIDFGDYTVPVVMIVQTSEVQQGDILIFPTSKVISVQQDSEKTQNIIVTVPSNYPEPITIQSVDFNPGVETISFGDLSLGQVAPGQSIQIPVIFSGIDAQVGTYQTNLNVFALNSQGMIDLPTVSLQLQVTSGVTPIDSTTFSTRPACSLSASSMNINQTYTFTCSGVVNNLEVEPQYSQYLEGITVDITSNIFTYTFKPVKYGNADFMALFTYRNTPIFEPFKQELRITSSGGAVPGTNLKFLFTPSLTSAQEGETIAIQLVDNKTNSLILDPEIEIDAIPLTNRSGRTFMFSFDTDKNYTLRGSAPGYNDILQEIRLTQKPIEVLITPNNGTTQTYFKITTDINATIYVNGESKGEIYEGYLIPGENTIEAFKEGWTDTLINMTVDSAITIKSAGEFKKGVNQVMTLNKNVSWTVYYQKDDEPREEYLTGYSSVIEFEPGKKGKYTIEAGETTRVYQIEGWDWNKKWWFVLAGVLILGYYYYTSGSSSSGSSSGVDMGFSGGAQY